jgi:dihydrofolate synthase/folylpolyglutamate synthase
MKLPFWPNPSNYYNIELGLKRVYQLLERLDNPHKKLPPTIHIAGTNGKGSTLAFLRAIFEDANLKVHTYTSPHLVRFNERIVLNGAEISDDFLNEILHKCQEAAEIQPKIDVTFFEGITVAAFLAFSQIKADVLLLEVGMGGRLDATNVIQNPIATIITPIAFDHTEFLGKTLAKIAFEKAGIIKPNCPVVISKQKPSALKVLKDVAEKNNSEVFVFEENRTTQHRHPGASRDPLYDEMNPDLRLDDDTRKNGPILPLLSLTGDHQIINAKTAIAAILAQKKFKISKENIECGLQKAVWPARLQKITDGKFFKILPNNFELILDGSHNSEGVKTIGNWLRLEQKKLSTKNYLICAMLKDKDSKGFLKHLVKQTEMLIGLKIKDESRSKTAEEIIEIAQSLNIKGQTASEFLEAIEQIKKYHINNYQNQPAKIIICGSLYFAGKFLEEN